MTSPDRAVPPQVGELVTQAGDWTLSGAELIAEDRGVFSTVWRLALSGRGAPQSAVAKVPAVGANGEAGRSSGAYDRELLAYRRILPSLSPPPHTPNFHGGLDDGSLLLEDLSPHRFVDQLVGLDPDDAIAIVDGLHALHRQHDGADLTSLPVRRSAPAGFSVDQLQAGLEVIADQVSQAEHRTLVDLVAHRDRLLEAFGQLPATLCHGDPRADNVAFEPTGHAILFDWQQLAIQHGEADLAWLAATSIRGSERSSLDHALVQRYAERSGRSFEEVQRRYRLGLLLPGFAVLLLAQRTVADGRMADLVRTSIERISRAVRELDVVGAVRT